MKKRAVRRFFAIVMIGFMLFWTALPSLGTAAFMTYGTPIQYGTPITGGNPMTGGEFMVPGNVYDYGNPVSGGQPGSSGQIIIPQNPSANGQFILPNIINSPKYNFLITGNAMDPGNAMTPGDVSSGGEAVNAGDASSNGNAVEGGDPAQNGDALNGGDAAGGGNAANGGAPSTGGIAFAGDDPSSGGDAVSGGRVTNGNTITGGDGSNSGEITPGEAGEGNALEGGAPGEGGTSPEGNSPDGVTPLNPNDGAPVGSGPEGGGPNGSGPDGNAGGGGGANSPSADQTTFQSLMSTLKSGKSYFITYRNHLANMLDGTLSITAGFKLTDLETASGKKNLWRVSGDPTAVKGSGKLSTWLNMRYSDYLNSFENSKPVVRGKGGGVAEIGKDGKKTTRNWAIFAPRDGQDLKQKRIQGFLDEIGPKSIWNKSKDYMTKNWVPTNKDFFGKSAFAKGNGIANVLLSVGSRLAENAADPTRTGTDLAAGITTDVLLGAGQTAVSAAAGWAASAATAAAIGSVVPGVGTVVGAAVGLGLGWFMSTKTGKGISRRVEGVVKVGINKIKDVGKGIVNGLKGLFGG